MSDSRTTAELGGMNLDVFRRYAGISLPRHVSYPMPTWWHDVDAADAGAMLHDAADQAPARDVSLYLHVPFCETLCRYCACTRVVLPRKTAGSRERVERYLAAVRGEIGRLGHMFGDGRSLGQVHWGGGSPTYLDAEQVDQVHRTVFEAFHMAPDAEIAMEVDPRRVTFEKLVALRRAGVNRVSLGVQDFNDRVQEHVRRIQPFEMIRDVVDGCRKLEFDSVNFDLIYGMPFQTVDTIRETVETTIGLSPDRIAFYHYAQIPEKIAVQRGMDYTKLPDSETKLRMFLTGLSMFEAAGYVFIGLDHFARPDEQLARSVADDSVQRNFQGMTTGGGLHLLGVGASSISHLQDVGFLQNVKGVEGYLTRMERDETPIERGKRFSPDDLIRQAVMHQLYCLAEVRPETIERRFNIDFGEYFERELTILDELQRDGLVTLGDDGIIKVTKPLGRVLIRNVGAVFDAYLDPDAYRKGEREYFSANA